MLAAASAIEGEVDDADEITEGEYIPLPDDAASGEGSGAAVGDAPAAAPSPPAMTWEEFDERRRRHPVSTADLRRAHTTLHLPPREEITPAQVWRLAEVLELLEPGERP